MGVELTTPQDGRNINSTIDLFQTIPPQQIIHKTLYDIKGNSDNSKESMIIVHFIEEVVQQQ